MKKLAEYALTFVISLSTLVGLSIVPTNAVGACAGFNAIGNWDLAHATETPDWRVLDGPGITFRVTWTLPDKNSCITNAPDDNRPGSTLNTKWELARSGDFTLLIARFDVPLSWIESREAPRLRYQEGITFSNLFKHKDISPNDTRGYGFNFVRGKLYLDDLWAIYISKKQGIHSEKCDVILSEKPYRATIKYLPEFTYRVENPGKSPILKIDIDDIRQCVHLVGTLPIVKDSIYDVWSSFPVLSKIEKYFAHYAFWDTRAKEYFSFFESNQIPKLRIASVDFARSTSEPGYQGEEADWVLHEILTPVSEIGHLDTVSREASRVTISSKLDLSKIDGSNVNPDSITGVYLGYYYPYSGILSCYGSSVSVTGSGSSFTVRSTSGKCLDPAQRFEYQTKYIQIPTLDLIYGVGKADSERKAISERKAAADKAVANAKAAADKAVADAKAAAEKAAAEKDAAEKAAADKASFERVLVEIDNLSGKVATLLIKKPELKTEIREIQSSLKTLKTRASEFSLLVLNYAVLAFQEEIKKYEKSTTITCVKGKLTKKVTEIKPVCPKGYKKK
jgi:hypothetical protein